MLPLAGEKHPASSAELIDALQTGLAARGFAPARAQVEAAAWPAIERLAIDFTGARVTRHVQLPTAVVPGAEALKVARLEMAGLPFEFEGVPVTLRLHAEDAALEAARSAQDEPLLALRSAAHGEVTIEIARPDLEAALHRAATTAAGGHGVEVKKTHLELTARNSRRLEVAAEVTAKMFLVSAAVKLAGEVSVDDNLTARLAHLRVGADGMLGSVVNSFAHPFLAKWENRELSLMAFSLGGVKLHDIAVQGGDALRLEGKFGAA
jgi:hypothetical protein